MNHMKAKDMLAVDYDSPMKSATESQALVVDITLCGMEVWGCLTLRDSGTLTAMGSQCGIHASQALVVDGCTVDARADGADITDDVSVGII